MVPRLKPGFVVLTNLGGTKLNEAPTNTLLDEYLGLPKVRDWNAHMLSVVKQNEAREKHERDKAREQDTKPSLPLSAYVGLYHKPAYGDVKVLLEEGKLKLEWARFQGELEHWNYDTWRVKDGGSLNDAMAKFQIDEKGTPSRLNLLGQSFSRK